MYEVLKPRRIRICSIPSMKSDTRKVLAYLIQRLKKYTHKSVRCCFTINVNAKHELYFYPVYLHAYLTIYLFIHLIIYLHFFTLPFSIYLCINLFVHILTYFSTNFLLVVLSRSPYNFEEANRWVEAAGWRMAGEEQHVAVVGVGEAGEGWVTWGAERGTVLLTCLRLTCLTGGPAHLFTQLSISFDVSSIMCSEYQVGSRGEISDLVRVHVFLGDDSSVI